MPDQPRRTEAEKRGIGLERAELLAGPDGLSPHARRRHTADQLWREHQQIGQANPEQSYFPTWVYRADDASAPPVIAEDEGALEARVAEGYERPSWEDAPVEEPTAVVDDAATWPRWVHDVRAESPAEAAHIEARVAEGKTVAEITNELFIGRNQRKRAEEERQLEARRHPEQLYPRYVHDKIARDEAEEKSIIAEGEKRVSLRYFPSAAALEAIDREAVEAGCSRLAALGRIVEKAADGTG
jgi:hypothetical protein